MSIAELIDTTQGDATASLTPQSKALSPCAAIADLLRIMERAKSIHDAASMRLSDEAANDRIWSQAIGDMRKAATAIVASCDRLDAR